MGMKAPGEQVPRWNESHLGRSIQCLRRRQGIVDCHPSHSQVLLLYQCCPNQLQNGNTHLPSPASQLLPATLRPSTLITLSPPALIRYIEISYYPPQLSIPQHPQILTKTPTYTLPLHQPPTTNDRTPHTRQQPA